mgnify:CR=1 FL=1
MKTVGVICEYNPFHLGHRKQLQWIRERFDGDCAVVCLMSGNFVQRGAPAILDKSLRAQAALMSGADLVLELPVTYALSSAEGFAAGGVAILAPFCDYLCFGSETADAEALMAAAGALLSGAFPPLLREELGRGLSFPAARQAALERMGANGDILSRPNDILAVEYCKAILSQGTSMKPLPIRRDGSYHAENADSENPSATAVRKLMLSKEPWQEFVPEAEIFAKMPLHSIQFGEKAILARLRTMTDAEFEALPYGSEGLWRKLMHNCRSCASLEEIIAATKSKRYTRTRLDRMVMCAFLGITAERMSQKPPYTRVLALNDTGRTVLKDARKTGSFLNAGEVPEDPWWDLENRCGRLYGLFRTDGLGLPDLEEKRRVYYNRENI